MGKVLWKPGTMIYPLPAVMVSCGTERAEYNIITISWTGTVCTDPPMCYISVRPSRHSYEIIRRSGEFVINLTTAKLARQADWCGVKSGKDFNKFEETGLTPAASAVVKVPSILESPVNIECVVKQIIELGSHSMFISEVVAVQAEEDLINSNTGAFSLIDSNIGKFGYSVEKKKKKK
jgi:flavin reductase (DIM6/NTAB) family NADH-FMN oxidoreductase RutF